MDSLMILNGSSEALHCNVHNHCKYDILRLSKKGIFIAQAKFPALKNYAWKCAGKAIKHRTIALKKVKSG